MNKTTAKKLVRRLVEDARDCARAARQFPASRLYWTGLAKGYISAARDLAHEAYGQNDLNARCRAQIAAWRAAKASLVAA